jgi:hypothetical protein
LLTSILVAACSPAPSPSPVAPVVTDTIGAAIVTHPVDWRLVAGPIPPSDGRAVPAFYLANAQLIVVPCPSFSDDGTYAGCAQPIDALPAGGVLVTLSPNLGLEEEIPPPLSVTAPTGPCASIGGERSIGAVTTGLVVEACLRGPGLDQSEAQFRAVVASMAWSPGPSGLT